MHPRLLSGAVPCGPCHRSDSCLVVKCDRAAARSSCTASAHPAIQRRRSTSPCVTLGGLTCERGGGTKHRARSRPWTAPRLSRRRCSKKTSRGCCSCAARGQMALRNAPRSGEHQLQGHVSFVLVLLFFVLVAARFSSREEAKRRRARHGGSAMTQRQRRPAYSTVHRGAVRARGAARGLAAAARHSISSTEPRPQRRPAAAAASRHESSARGGAAAAAVWLLARRSASSSACCPLREARCLGQAPAGPLRCAPLLQPQLSPSASLPPHTAA